MRTAFVTLLAAAYMAASGNAIQLAEPTEFAQISTETTPEEMEYLQGVKANLRHVEPNEKHYVVNKTSGAKELKEAADANS